MFKCPRNKKCNSCLIFECRGGDFICSGINTKPTKYKKDVIKLCLKGQLADREIEMTQREACFIASAIMASVGKLSPAILKKQKK